MNKPGKTADKTLPPKSTKYWSGRRESNPRMQLGKLAVSQYKPELSCKTSEFARERDQWVRNPLQNIFERDDGLFEIGLSDARGPFESRRFAEAVASRRFSGDDPPKRRRPGSGKPERYSLVLDAAVPLTYAKRKSLSTESYRVVAPNGLLIGSYPSRLEAAKASGRCA